jgi:thiamine pyrophosphokinase
MLEKRKKDCYIFGAGEHYDMPESVREGFVIAADAGFAFLASRGLTPDLAVGDFDSLGSPPECENVIRLPRVKDDTDMAAAVREGWKRGFRVFRVYGGVGGRADHTLANVQLAAGVARRGGRLFLNGRDDALTAIHDGEISFPASASGLISVFAHSDVCEGVCESGLLYSLSDARLNNCRPVGVSNEFIGKASRVSVKSGTLVLIFPKDALA